MTIPTRRFVSYQARGLDVAQLGVNMGNFVDDAHVALAMSMGATLLRTQFSWDLAENYATGAFALTTSWQAFLASCAARGAKPVIVAAYSGPRQTIGTLTVSAPVASGSPAGTPIPVQAYAFTIQPNSTDFAGGSTFTSSTGVGNLTSLDEWVGMPITAAASGSIQISKALSRSLAIGDKINIQRARYGIPLSNSDPGVAAYGRYVQWIAQQIAAAGCKGYVCVWNEYEWPHDHWSAPNSLYDTGGPSTIGARMGPFLQNLQTLSLPSGVKLINGVTDKSGSNSIAGTQVHSPGANFAYEGAHTYGQPEYQCWDLYATDSGGYEALNVPDTSSNFRGMAHTQDVTPGQSWPDVMFTETGEDTANDTIQARSNARRVLCRWGLGSPSCIYVLDDNSAPGSVTYSIAPRSTTRQSYTALQRIMQVLGRMGTNAFRAAVPDVVAWNTDGWPLMVTRIRGNTSGHSVLFAWQRTFDLNDNTWPTIPSPPAQTAQVGVPPGLQVAECFDVVTGSTVTPTGPDGNRLLSLPVTDNPVAVRFAPS